MLGYSQCLRHSHPSQHADTISTRFHKREIAISLANFNFSYGTLYIGIASQDYNCAWCECATPALLLMTRGYTCVRMRTGRSLKNAEFALSNVSTRLLECLDGHSFDHFQVMIWAI